MPLLWHIKISTYFIHNQGPVEYTLYKSMPRGFCMGSRMRHFLSAIVGFVTGVLMVTIFDGSGSFAGNFFGSGVLERLADGPVVQGHLFWYVFWERMKPVLLVGLMGTTVFGVMAAYVYGAWLGLSVGVLLSVMIVRFGLGGILFFLGSLFPQYLLFIPFMIYLLRWCTGLCNGIYFPESSDIVYYGSRRRFMIKCTLQFLFIIAGIMATSGLESYVNPYILHGVAKFFWGR